jgi:hypothetical protein
MARAQDEWVVKKIPGSGVACGVVRYGATVVLRSALVLKNALQVENLLNKAELLNGHVAYTLIKKLSFYTKI